MLFICAVSAVREQQLHSEVAVAVLMQLLKHTHGKVALGGCVECGVEVPIEWPPPGGLASVQRILELVDDIAGPLELLVVHLWNGATQQVALDLRAQLEELIDFVERQAGDHRATVRVEGDQSLGLELSEGFADGNSADAKLVGEGVLAQGLAFRVVPTEDSLAQGGDGHAGDRLPLYDGRPGSARRRRVPRSGGFLGRGTSRHLHSTIDVRGLIGYSILCLEQWQAYLLYRRHDSGGIIVSAPRYGPARFSPLVSS